MQIGSAEHKAQYTEEVIKLTQENIWTLEIQKADAEEHLRKKKKYLELIPKRMEEKFYPSANDGRQDEKDTKDSIINLTANIDKFIDLIALEQRKIEMIKHWASLDD
jgi:hypothetical protein